MMVVTHAFMGAAGGEVLRNPVLAFILGVVVHIIVDKIPHFLPSEKKARFKNWVLDGILTGVVLAFIAFFSVNSGKLSLLFGALGGVSVDVVLVVLAGIYKPLYDSKVRVWHSERQSHKENYWFLLTDIVLIALTLMILFQ